MDLVDAGELLAYFTAFWCFLFWPAFRRRRIAEFLGAGAVRRGFMLLEGVIATFCGLLPLMLARWAFAP
jgi:hypothetical protein